MSLRGPVAAAVGCVLLLSGCAPSNSPSPHRTEPTPTVSRPAFLTSPQTDADVLNYANSQPLDFDPGTQFQYNNTGFMLLADIVTRIAGAKDYISFGIPLHAHENAWLRLLLWESVVVRALGLEPRTNALKGRCSTN